MAFATFTLKGTYLTSDSQPQSGTVYIMPTVTRIVDAAGEVVLSGTPIAVEIDEVTGIFTKVLPDPNDAALNPTGFGYRVRPHLSNIVLPEVVVGPESITAGDTLDMSTVTEVDASAIDPTATYLTSVDRTELEAAIAASGGGSGIEGAPASWPATFPPDLTDASLASALGGKADAADVTALEGRVTSVEADVVTAAGTATWTGVAGKPTTFTPDVLDPDFITVLSTKASAATVSALSAEVAGKAEVPELAPRPAKWKYAQAYAVGDLALDLYGEVIRCTTAHTATAEFDPTKWERNPVYQRANTAPAVMCATLYEARTERRKKVMYQDGSRVYATSTDSVNTVYVSTDRGVTWTTKGNIGAIAKAFTRVPATGTLIAYCTDNTLRRSTDDGGTWTTATTLNFGPLGSQSLVVTPSGYIVAAEYGNTGSTVYRLMRSTNDGANWSQVLASGGTDPADDPGHFHCVVWDKYQSVLVAQCDRAEPDIYQSADEGATWTLIGSATNMEHPNFVAPMFFEDYVAWGYDSSTAGQIARLPRADFYAGNWSDVELVAALNPKAFYWSFPIQEGVWIQIGSSEHLGAHPEGIGSYAFEAYIVYDNGAKVSGAFSHYAPDTDLFLTGNVAAGADKSVLPAYNHTNYDQGVSWVLHDGGGGTGSPQFGSVPYSVGMSYPMPTTSPMRGLTPPTITTELGAGVSAISAAGVRHEVVAYDTNNRVIFKNPHVAANAMPELRFYESSFGVLRFLVGGQIGFAVEGVGVGLPPMLRFGTSSGPILRTGTGTPEGVISGPIGSMFLRTDGGAGTTFYIKESGTGNTGWIAK